MKNRLRLLAAVSVLGLIATSCFTMRGFWFSTNFLEPGGAKSVLNINLQPGIQGEGSRDYPFIILGFGQPTDGDPNLAVVAPKKFDVNGKFGPPRDLVADGPLRDFILNNSTCSESHVEESSTMRWIVLRTPTRVHDHGMLAKTALTKIGIKAKGTTPDDVYNESVRIVNGTWQDDGDGVPEPFDIFAGTGDPIFCHSEALTVLAIKQTTPPTEQDIERNIRVQMNRNRLDR